MGKKGQAALEFLMTYGWIISAAILVIGILANFGVFSPGKYAPGACTVTAPFYCNAWNAKADTNTITIEVKNTGIETYTISGLAVAGCGNTTGAGNISATETKSMGITCTPALETGGTIKGSLITLTYTKLGSTTELVSIGSISQKVTGQVIKTCTEDDGGNDKFVKGKVNYTVSGKSYEYIDYCKDSQNLLEYYCTYGTDFNEKDYYCQKGCINGACIKN